MTILEKLNQFVLNGELPIYDVKTIVSQAMDCSKSHAQELINERAVKINGSVVNRGAIILDGDILKVGSKRFFKLSGYPKKYMFKI
ncbi:MAG: S4 domain-containing protein [Nanoarchaeota archaeon]